MKIKFTLISESAKSPVFATSGSAGADLFAALDEKAATLVIKPAERVLVPTGLKLEIPCGYGGFVFPRSSLAAKFGISLANCVGVIDSDYRGELLVPIINLSGDNYIVNKGDRIAQLVILPLPAVEYEKTDEFTDTVRGEGGFGSSGK